MAFTTEVHVAASPSVRHAHMLFFLVHSLAERAAFPGDWRVVITLGHDGAHGPTSPAFAWAADFPVSFHRPDRALWDTFVAEAAQLGAQRKLYDATILAQFDLRPQADVSVFLDADTVVTAPFNDVLEQVLDVGGVAAKPAWQPPPIDLAEIVAKFGLAYEGPLMEYSGWGWQFTEPRYDLPYLNGGFQAWRKDAAEVQCDATPDLFQRVLRQHFSHFKFQIAQTLLLVGHDISWHPVDERFNLGIGSEITPPLIEGAEGAALLRLAYEQFEDRRVIHYCTPTPNFRRDRTLSDPEELDAFLSSDTLLEGERALQEAFKPYASEWRAAFHV